MICVYFVLALLPHHPQASIHTTHSPLLPSKTEQSLKRADEGQERDDKPGEEAMTTRQETGQEAGDKKKTNSQPPGTFLLGLLPFRLTVCHNHQIFLFERLVFFCSRLLHRVFLSLIVLISGASLFSRSILFIPLLTPCVSSPHFLVSGFVHCLG